MALRSCVLLLAVATLGATPRLAVGAAAPAEASAAALEQAVVQAIAAAEKSVVAIARIRRERPGEDVRLEVRPDLFGRRPSPPVGIAPTDPDFVPNEYGTGVVIDRHGLVLTAYHVLGVDSDYYVTTHERRVYRATIKGADPRSDLAVLALDGAQLEPIVLGDAAGVRKGQIVVALGNPYAIGRDGQASASWGIVANLGRKIPSLGEEAELPSKRTIHQYGTLLQTDVRLNQGTSGGALLNLRGEMIGLTLAFAATPGADQAAGYAIPIDATFRRVIETLKEGREVEYGFLGVRPANLKPAEVAQGRQGIRVQSVVAGTPAERFGLRSDDLLLSLGGRPLSTSDALMLEVGRLPADATARFDVERAGRRLQLDVVLAKYPVAGRKVVTVPAAGWRGLRVDYLTAVADSDGGASSRASSFDDGVAVVEVEPGKPAWNAGLRTGMVIAEVDQAPVRTPKEFRAAVSGKNGPVQVRLLRRGEGEPETVRIPAAG